MCLFVCVRACSCAHMIVCPGEMGGTKTPDIYLQEIAQKDLRLTSPGPFRNVYAMLSDLLHASIHTMLKTGMQNTTLMPLSAHEKEILSIIVQIEERNHRHILTATGTLDYQCIHICIFIHLSMSTCFSFQHSVQANVHTPTYTACANLYGIMSSAVYLENLQVIVAFRTSDVWYSL